MAYDITPKTQPANMDYENSKAFARAAQYAHEDKMQQDRIKAAQPSKYMQTLQAINSTLQTVNNGLQVAENVSNMYDQITEKSFKQEQLEKQNRLKEEIQGAINDHDWDRVATLAMTNLQTASQMPEYMDSLGRMAKIAGNEGSAAILRSVNTEQQGKLELEELKNLGKLQVENTKGQYSLQRQALSNQGAMQRAIYNQSQQNARFNERLKFNQDRAAMQEEGRNIRQQNSIDSKNNKSTSPVKAKNAFEQAILDRQSGNSSVVTPTPTPTATETPTSTESNSYVNNFKNKTYTVPLTSNSQNERLAAKQQQAIDASNAPTKQEQIKAQENNKRTLENQQTTNELVNSYQNSELPSMMYNFKNAKGADPGSKLNYILTNPEEYDVNIVTEPKDIRTIINGTDNNLANTNLADKYNNVISIAQIKELSTGKTQNLYLDANQAHQFNSIANYADEKNQEIKRAMGENNSIYSQQQNYYMGPNVQIPYRPDYTLTATPTLTPTPSPTLQQKEYNQYKSEVATELETLPKDIKDSPQAVGAVVQEKVTELSKDPDALNSFINGPITNVIAKMTPEEQQALRKYVPQMSIPVKQQIARIVLTAVANKESKDSMIKKIKTILNKSKIYSDYLNTANQSSRDYLENFNQAIRPTGYIY